MNPPPPENKCNLDDIVHQANILAKENHNIDKTYIGMTNLNWKFRYYSHLQTFKNPMLSKKTDLSKYYCDL